MIEFRGFCKDNDSWVYGSLVEEFDRNKLDENGRLSVFYQIYSKISGWHVVEKDSIGQYSGINDINGNKIFSGHKVKMIGGFYDGLERAISFRYTKFIFGEETPIYTYKLNMLITGDVFSNLS